MLVPGSVAQDEQGRGNNPGVAPRTWTGGIRGWRSRVPAGGAVTGPFLVRLVFDEEVKGFELVDLTVDNGTASGLRRIEVAGWEYVATITPAGPGELTVELAANRVQDTAGRGNVVARFSITSAVPAVLLSLSRETLSEGGGAVAVAVTATLNGGVRASDTPVAVTVSGSGLPGVVGFAPVAPFTLTIPAQRSHAAAVFTLTPQDDNTDEGDETVSVSGTATGLQVEIATLVLSDDDQTSTMMNWRVSPLRHCGRRRCHGRDRDRTAGRGGIDHGPRLRIRIEREIIQTLPSRSTKAAERSRHSTSPSRRVRRWAPAWLTVTPVQDLVVEPDVRGGANRLQVEINDSLRFDTAPDADLPVEDVDRVRVTIIDERHRRAGYAHQETAKMPRSPRSNSELKGHKALRR